MEKKVQRNFLWIALLVLGTIWILARHNQVTPYQTDFPSGTFHVKHYT